MILCVGGTGCGKSYLAEGDAGGKEEGLGIRFIRALSAQQPTAMFRLDFTRFTMPRPDHQRNPKESADGVVAYRPGPNDWAIAPDAIKLYVSDTKARRSAAQKTRANSTSSRDQRHVSISVVGASFSC